MSMPGCPAPYPYVRPVPHSRATTRCGSLRSTREGNFETHTNRACCRGFASFGGLVGGVSLGLPRRRYRLGWLRAQLLRHRCQAHRAPSMRELQPDPGLHDPVVSSRRLKRRAALRAGEALALDVTVPRHASSHGRPDHAVLQFPLPACCSSRVIGVGRSPSGEKSMLGIP